MMPLQAILLGICTLIWRRRSLQRGVYLPCTVAQLFGCQFLRCLLLVRRLERPKTPGRALSAPAARDMHAASRVLPAGRAHAVREAVFVIRAINPRETSWSGRLLASLAEVSQQGRSDNQDQKRRTGRQDSDTRGAHLVQILRGAGCAVDIACLRV